MNYYLARDGQTYGPYPEESILTMLEAGQVVPEDLLCAEGGSEWVPLNQIPAFAPATPPPIPQVATGAAPAGLRVSTPAPKTHAPAIQSVATPAREWAPAKPTIAEKAGSMFGTVKLFAYAVVAVIIAIGAVLGFIAAQRDAKEIEKLHVQAGWNAFAAANEKIASESSEAGYGNNGEASQLSTRLASILGRAQKENFTMEKSYRGRGKIGRIVSAVDSANAGTGKFQTFLEMRDDRAIVLIHVPEFKRYKGETRESMRQMCWEVARVGVTAAKKAETAIRNVQPAPATRTPLKPARRGPPTNALALVSKAMAAQPPPDFQLIVGLRDKNSYDCVFTGKLSDLTFTEENMPQAAKGNVPSHELLVKWFGADKAN
jgi:hypothetical protein